MAKDISEVAYEKYQLDWMMKHNISITDLVEELDTATHTIYAANSGDGIPSLINVFSDWEKNKGFEDGIWSERSEFMSHEYEDKAYIEALLSNNEYEEYLGK